MKIVFAALAALLMSNANAAVQYQWHLETSSEATPHPLGLSMTFSPSAVRSGHLEYRFVCEEDAEGYCAGDHASPLRELSFTMGGATPISFFPRKDRLLSGSDIFISVDFLANGYLKGEIYAVSRETDFRMSSVGTLFTLDRAHSDAFDGDCAPRSFSENGECYGATGVIRAVPEPSTVSLAGLALSGILLVRRRKIRK